MAITVKYLEDLGVEKEVAEKIFAERSKEIEADKAKREKLETELKESKESLESLTTEIDTLKTSGKNAEEIQAKLDALIAEREAEKTKAEADRIMKEKQENILKVKAMLEALPDKIDFIREMQVNINVNPKEGMYDAVLISAFDTLEDVGRYSVHPEHKKISSFVALIREGRASVDYEI